MNAYKYNNPSEYQSANIRRLIAKLSTKLALSFRVHLNILLMERNSVLELVERSSECSPWSLPVFDKSKIRRKSGIVSRVWFGLCNLEYRLHNRQLRDWKFHNFSRFLLRWSVTLGSVTFLAKLAFFVRFFDVLAQIRRHSCSCFEVVLSWWWPRYIWISHF